MSIEALVLALTTVVRPTSATAVVAILASRSPQRLLAYYIVSGLAFSLAVGALVVLLLEGLSIVNPSRTHHPLIEVALGVSALCYAGFVWLGWLPRRRDHRPEHQGWLGRRLSDLTPAGASIAGVLTHLPGLIYLTALNAIAASSRGTLSELVQVGIYNVIWFSLAIVALAMSVRRPDTASQLLEQLGRWGRQHHRAIMVGFFGVLGGYLLVVGIRGLLQHLT